MDVLYFDSEIYRMLEHFRVISGLRVGIHDLSMDILLEYPKKSARYDQLRFCDRIRYFSPDYTSRCKDCDLTALKTVKVTRKPMIYRCHAGFTEALVPVIVDGEIRCVLMIGQVRGEKGGKDPLSLALSVLPDEVLREHRGDLVAAFEEMPVIGEERFRSLVYFLEICAQSIFRKHLIRAEPQTLTESFLTYVEENLFKPITVRSAASTLLCSTATLSRHISADLGTNFTTYLTRRRVEEAKRMLSDTSLPIKTIASILCYETPAYFMRLFKRETGMTCLAWRETTQKKGK